MRFWRSARPWRMLLVAGAALLALLGTVAVTSTASTFVPASNAGQRAVPPALPCSTVSKSVYGSVYGGRSVSGAVYGAPATTLTAFRDTLWTELLRLDPNGCDPLRAELLHINRWTGTPVPTPPPPPRPTAAAHPPSRPAPQPPAPSWGTPGGTRPTWRGAPAPPTAPSWLPQGSGSGGTGHGTRTSPATGPPGRQGPP